MISSTFRCCYKISNSKQTTKTLWRWPSICSTAFFSVFSSSSCNSSSLVASGFPLARRAFLHSVSSFASLSCGTVLFPNQATRSQAKHTSTTTMTTANTNTAKTSTCIPPPTPRRDETRVIYAGVAPPKWDTKLPRQSASSKEPLLDPPIPVPDPYGWLRDESRSNEDVLNHLNAENEYTKSATQHLESLRKELYEEMVGRLQETDYTTPRPRGDFVYYTRTYKGKSYKVHCRAPRTKTSSGEFHKVEPITWDEDPSSPVLPGEQVTLDVNALAEGQSYCATGNIVPSSSHKYLAYSVDLTGDEVCQLYIKDLSTDNIVDFDPDLAMSGSIRWGKDDKTLFYLKQDKAKRPYRLYRRHLNLEQQEGDNDKETKQEDGILFEEPDELYWLRIYKSLDEKYLFLRSSSKETSEVHYLDLEDPNAKLRCVATRRSKVLYNVEHCHGQWLIQSNVGSLPNYALWMCPAEADCASKWDLVRLNNDAGELPLFDGGYDRSLDDVTCFHGHLVARGREGGIPRVWVSSLEEKRDESSLKVVSFTRLSFDEDAYDVDLAAHHEFTSKDLVVTYDSLITPTQSIQVDMDHVSQRTVLKERAVPGYEKNLYDCQRIIVASRDGKTDIPVSLVYRKDVMEASQGNGKPVPVHLYGYGSYGHPMEASFVSTRLALLNRGVVYVIAHVRGGGEMGRKWYEAPDGAKYLCKKNTFFDFCDVAQHLIEEKKLTLPELLSCEGRSAGGLLIGASINEAPQLFRAALLGVPFVDVVCTMIDASIPLTVVEWEEWGNPNEEKYHQYMMEYSPMQNVGNVERKNKAKVYPACLLTGGLHDPRVQYWEPAKFAAELRHHQHSLDGEDAEEASRRPICLKIEMSAGHFSASDRYKYLRELAFDYAFVLDQLGLVKDEKEV